MPEITTQSLAKTLAEMLDERDDIASAETMETGEIGSVLVTTQGGDEFTLTIEEA